MLGEHVVHRLTNSNQRQNLDRKAGFVQLLHPDEHSIQSDSLEAVAAHHNGEDDSSHSRFEDPEESQTQALDEGEEVDTSLGNMPQVDQVRLVLGWHQE